MDKEEIERIKKKIGGLYPGNYEEEFEKRYKKVEVFVSKLEEKRGG